MEREIKYVLAEHKKSVTVYADGFITCIIDDDFAIKYGYLTAIEYCKKVFA